MFIAFVVYVAREVDFKCVEYYDKSLLPYMASTYMIGTNNVVRVVYARMSKCYYILSS